MEGETEIKRSLSADIQHDGVRFFLRNDFAREMRRQGQEIDAVGKPGVRLDGGDIGIEEDGFNFFFFQRFDRLRAGIVEFAGLAYFKTAGSDNEHLMRERPFFSFATHGVVHSDFE